MLKWVFIVLPGLLIRTFNEASAGLSVPLLFQCAYLANCRGSAVQDIHTEHPLFMNGIWETAVYLADREQSWPAINMNKVSVYKQKKASGNYSRG